MLERKAPTRKTPRNSSHCLPGVPRIQFWDFRPFIGFSHSIYNYSRLGRPGFIASSVGGWLFLEGICCWYVWNVVGTFETLKAMKAARRSTRWCTPKMAGCTPKMAGFIFHDPIWRRCGTMGFSTISSDPFSKVLLQVGIYLEHQNHPKHWIGKI